jgi:hypothetical protein
VLLSLAVGLAGCPPDVEGPGPTTQRFWDAIGMQDFAAAQALTDQAKLSELRDLANAHSFESVEIGAALHNEALAQVPTRIKRHPAAGPDFSLHTHLVRGEAGWRVDVLQTRRDLTRELLASSFEGVQEALRESGEAFIEEFEKRALEASEALRETLEELEKSLNDPEVPAPQDL